MAREVKQWITVNGVHVPIFEGQSKEEAVKQAISRQKKRGPVSSNTRDKAVADYVQKKRQYRDAYDHAEVFQRHYDRASNAEDREAANIKLKSAARDRDSKLQEYAKASDRVANLGKGGKVRRGVEFGKSGKQGQITHYSDIKQVPKKLKLGEQYALYLKKGKVPNDGSKFAGQSYNAEYQGKGTYGVSNPKDMSPEAGFKTYEAMKKAYEERSKLPGQSYEIAVIKSGDNKNVKISSKKEEQQKQMGPAEKKPNRKDTEHKIIENRRELRKSNDPERKRELINENHKLMKSLDKDFGEMSKEELRSMRDNPSSTPTQKHDAGMELRKRQRERYAELHPEDKKDSKKSFKGKGISEFADYAKTDEHAQYLLDRVEEAKSDGYSEGKSAAEWAKELKDQYGYDYNTGSKSPSTPAPASKGSTSEFKNRQEAEEFYKNKFAGVSATYANKMAKKLGIEGRGKDKREALAKHYTDQWETRSNVSKNEAEKEKQIARNEAERKQAGQSSETQPKLSEKIQRAVKNALADRVWTKARGSEEEQSEIAADNWRYAGISNEKMVKLMNEVDPEHEYRIEKYSDKKGGRTYNHQILCREPKEGGDVTVTPPSKKSGVTKVGETSGGTFNLKEMQAKLDRERAEKVAKEKALSDEANRTFKPAGEELKRAAQAEVLKSLGINRDAAINEIRNWTGLSLEEAERRLGSMSADQIKKMLGKQNKTIPKKIPASQVSISDSSYRFSNGKAPKGYGNWAFYLGDDYDNPIFFQGSYADAKKKAIREAANRGVNKIRVGS